MNAIRTTLMAALSAALVYVPSAALSAPTSFITGAVSGYPTGWSAQGTTLADSVSVTDDANNVHTNLAFSLGDAETITYTPASSSAAGGTADVVISEGDCVIMTRDEYKQHDSEPGMAGVGGYQYYDFTAVKPGAATVTFTYARSWETTDSDVTYVAVITVADDLTVTVDFTEQ